jgi:hypothetical protein
LWLALASLALFEPIAVAVHFEDVDVVGQSVERFVHKSAGLSDQVLAGIGPPRSRATGA